MRPTTQLLPEYAILGRRVTGALAQLPGIDVCSSEREARIGQFQADLILDARVHGRSVLLLVECKTQAYPRDVRAGIWQLTAMRDAMATKHGSEFVVPMFVAPAITQSSRGILRQHQVAYWDTSDSLYLDLPWAHYFIDRPVPKQAERTLREVYRGSSAQVLHALLLDPGRAWHLNELAQRAEVSASTAHDLCAFLEEQLWMDREGTGPRTIRILREPGALLDAWADAHSLGQYRQVRFHRWMPEVTDLRACVATALTEHQVDYALTLDTGAMLVAPYVTGSDRLHIIVPETASSSLAAVAHRANLQEVDEGESVVFWVSRDRSPLLFTQTVDGYCVASDVQLYLDLWGWPRRGKGQAQHLRTERLGY